LALGALGRGIGSLVAKLQPAPPFDGYLLEGIELAFEAAQFGCGCAIALHEESGWPEDDEGNARCYGV
jgi:hypothetical protein